MFSKSVIAKVSISANKIKVETAAILAVAEVESAGVTSWNVNGDNVPVIRFEGHYFYKLLAGNKAKQQQAVKAGLAHPKAGAVKNPANPTARYAMLARAEKIDRNAAFASCSWGLGQVMGSHWKKLGYSSVLALKQECSTVEGQIELMIRYIKAFGLVDELQSKGFASFAAQYNGPAYKKNRYDEKMARAYKKWTKQLANDPNGTFDNGVRQINDDATQIQNDLKKLGYYRGPVNGKYGPLTKQAVRVFQKANGLVPDGNYGLITSEAIDAAILEHRSTNDDRSVIAGGSSTGAGAAAEVIRDQTSSLEQISYYTQSEIITWLIIGLMVVGMGLTIFGLVRKYRRGKEG